MIAGLGAKTASQPEAVGRAQSLARPLRVHCVRPNSLPVNLPQRICTQQGASGKSGCRCCGGDPVLLPAFQPLRVLARYNSIAAHLFRFIKRLVRRMQYVIRLRRINRVNTSDTNRYSDMPIFAIVDVSNFCACNMFANLFGQKVRVFGCRRADNYQEFFAAQPKAQIRFPI